MRKSFPIGVTVLTTMAVIFAIYSVINTKNYDERLKAMENVENRKVVLAIVTEVSHVSSPPVYYVHYSYECNGRAYSGKCKLPDVKDTSVIKTLPQKRISIAVSNDCDFSYPILTKDDANKFKIKLDTSTVALWVMDNLKT
jgi:hypothetical protein